MVHGQVRFLSRPQFPHLADGHVGPGRPWSPQHSASPNAAKTSVQGTEAGAPVSPTPAPCPPAAESPVASWGRPQGRAWRSPGEDGSRGRRGEPCPPWSEAGCCFTGTGPAPPVLTEHCRSRRGHRHAAAETRAVRGLTAQPARIPSSFFTASRTEGSSSPETSAASGATPFPPD